MPYKNGTLMQFTGLLDKHGKEIYEGDLLDFDEDEWGEKFYPEEIRMDLIIGKWSLSGSLEDVSQYRSVVGNIYKINQQGERK